MFCGQEGSGKSVLKQMLSGKKYVAEATNLLEITDVSFDKGVRVRMLGN